MIAERATEEASLSEWLARVARVALEDVEAGERARQAEEEQRRREVLEAKRRQNEFYAREWMVAAFGIRRFKDHPAVYEGEAEWPLFHLTGGAWARTDEYGARLLWICPDCDYHGQGDRLSPGSALIELGQFLRKWDVECDTDDCTALRATPPQPPQPQGVRRILTIHAPWLEGGS